jgi:hypothetical protein
MVRKAIDAASSSPQAVAYHATMKKVEKMAKQIAEGTSLYELCFPNN